MTVTIALSLLYLGVVRIFEPSTSDKVLLVGVYLIAVTAALCLNAFTVGATTQPSQHPQEESLRTAPTAR
jgi:hypothetical protein